MAEAADLVPSFMPPLAMLLAVATNKKGSRLTEEEVNSVRDSAVCMMVPRKVHETLQSSREFRDVDPENCWADWHRLEAQLTEQGYLPKMILCSVGNGNLEADLRAVLSTLQSTITLEAKGRDPRTVSSFAVCNIRKPLPPVDVARVRDHTNVVYVVSSNYTAKDAKATALEMLKVIQALLTRNNSVAITCESSGVGHSAEEWLSLAANAQQEPMAEEAAFALFNSFVQYPIASAVDYYSCGMHLLGLPDCIITTQLTKSANATPAPLLFQMFCTYLISMDDTSKFHAGHTFRTGPTAPRYRLQWESCTGYDEDDFFNNPFGRWRFTEV